MCVPTKSGTAMPWCQCGLRNSASLVKTSLDLNVPTFAVAGGVSRCSTQPGHFGPLDGRTDRPSAAHGQSFTGAGGQKEEKRGRAWNGGHLYKCVGSSNRHGVQGHISMRRMQKNGFLTNEVRVLVGAVQKVPLKCQALQEWQD